MADERARLATKQRALALEPVDAWNYLDNACAQGDSVGHGVRGFWVVVWEVLLVTLELRKRADGKRRGVLLLTRLAAHRSPAQQE